MKLPPAKNPTPGRVGQHSLSQFALHPRRKQHLRRHAHGEDAAVLDLLPRPRHTPSRLFPQSPFGYCHSRIRNKGHAARHVAADTVRIQLTLPICASPYLSRRRQPGRHLARRRRVTLFPLARADAVRDPLMYPRVSRLYPRLPLRSVRTGIRGELRGPNHAIVSRSNCRVVHQ